MAQSQKLVACSIWAILEHSHDTCRASYYCYKIQHFQPQKSTAFPCNVMEKHTFLSLVRGHCLKVTLICNF